MMSFKKTEKALQRNEQWMSLVKKVASVGPANAAILDTEKGIIQKSKDQMLFIKDK